MRNVNILVGNSSRAAIAILAALALGTTACGSDAAVVGSQSVGSDDSTSGNDGALSGADTSIGTGDGIATSDAVVSFVCGNGKCEGPTETSTTCPADCATVVGPDAAGGPAVCGNGICEGPDETMLLCAADCKAPASAAETCKHKACPKEYDACTADAACVAAVKCFNAGGGNECVTSQQVGQEVQGLTTCVQQSGCNGGGGGGGGGGTTATCGDGTCDQGETMLTCPKDCTQPQTPTEACYHKACPGEYTACSADAACVKVVDCMNTGGSQQQCGMNKNQMALNQCIQGSGCTGGGGGGGGGLANCGNGVCDPGELVLTCPADCKTPTDPQETCLQKSCATEYKTCQADPTCVKVVDCVNNNQNNPQQCMQGGGMGGAVGGLFQCGQSSGCFGGGGGGGGTGTAQTTCQGNCGNYSNVAGSCQCDNQCAQNGDCCKDFTTLCGGAPTACGDGACTAPQETAANCPADCAPPAPTPCKTKADCAATEVCCGLASGSVCTAVGQCK